MRRIIVIAVLLLCLAGPRVQHRGEICMACRATTPMAMQRGIDQ